MEFFILILFTLSIYIVFSLKFIKKNIRSHNHKILSLQDEIRILKESILENENIANKKIDNEVALERKTLKREDLRSEDKSGKNKVLEKAITKSSEGQDNIFEKIKMKSNQIKSKKKNILSIESIIPKLGILLLLIGVGFIFKLTYDSGILTESLVLIIASVFGFLLMLMGEYVRKKKRELLSQVLFGGGLATLFITTYSAYQVYAFIGSSSAFIIMSLLTILTFIVAIYLDSMAISIVGLLGGLLTPFFVDLKFLGLYGLGLYMVFLSVASMIIYVYKAWRTLQISVILGIYSINIYLISLINKNQSDSYKLAGLIIILYILFNAVEYGLIYTNKKLKLDNIVRPILIGILPISTIAQLSQISYISNTKWSILALIFSIIYIVLWEMLFRKNAYSIISDILLALSSLFLLFACSLYFDGSLRGISLISIGILLYFVGVKRKHLYSQIVSHIIFLISFLYALIDMIDAMFDIDYIYFDAIGHFAILILIIIGSLMQKNRIKLIYGIFSLEIYMMIFIESLVWQITKSYDISSACLIIVYGLSLIFISIINKYQKLVPNISIGVLSLIPILLKIIVSGISLWTLEFKLYDFSAYIIYGLMIYALSINSYFKWDNYQKLLLKLSSVAIIQISVLVDIYILMDNFAYGLFIVGAMNLIMYYFESDKEIKLIKVLNEIFCSVWIASTSIYALSSFSRDGFDPLVLCVDAGLILILYLIFKILDIKREISFVLHWLFYIIIVSQNFSTLDFGSATTTILWAAYSIISLTFAVKNSEKSLANIALIMILFVAGKFVIIDLARASILWKIITSMLFGSALLVISYVLQPVFEKKDDN